MIIAFTIIAAGQYYVAISNYASATGALAWDRGNDTLYINLCMLFIHTEYLIKFIWCVRCGHARTHRSADGLNVHTNFDFGAAERWKKGTPKTGNKGVDCFVLI